MKASRSKVLEEAAAFSSYILIQTIDRGLAESFPLALAGAGDKTFNYSVSTLILPTKEPLLVTVGYFLFPLLSQDELKSLTQNQYLKLDNDELRKRIRFYLYHNEKLDANNESDKDNYIELVPTYLFLSKELANSFSEIFKFRSKNSNTFFDSHPSLKTNGTYAYSKFFSILVLESTNPAFFPMKLRYSHILNIEKPTEGEKVYILSSPYALVSPMLYKNTVQVAQICKVASKPSKKSFYGSRKGFIFLTNSSAKEGEEGSPVFNRELQVLGITLGNISPYSQDSTGFTVCLGTHYLIDLLLRAPDSQMSNDVWKILTSKYRPTSRTMSIKTLIPRIVKVMIGTTIGSGILLGAHGYILTNKHVVENKEGMKITIEINYHDGYELYVAELFEISHGNLDMALLKITQELSAKAKRLIDRKSVV